MKVAILTLLAGFMFSASVLSGRAAIAPPAHVYALESGDTSTVVLWDRSANAVSYDVYRNGKRIAVAQTGTVYNDTGLNAGFGYGYTITSVDTRHRESAQSFAAIVATSTQGISACPGEGSYASHVSSIPIASILAALPSWLADAEDDERAIAAGNYRTTNAVAAQGAINFIDMANRMLHNVLPYAYCQPTIFTAHTYQSISQSMLQSIHDAMQDAYAHLIARTDPYAGKLSGFIATKGFDGWNDYYYYTLPAPYNPSTAYKLDIHLHAASYCSIAMVGVPEGYGTKQLTDILHISRPSTVSNTTSRDTIYIDPCDRNVYAGPAQQSLLDTIADIERHFKIDTTQITIHGESMGPLEIPIYPPFIPTCSKAKACLPAAPVTRCPETRAQRESFPQVRGDPRYDAQNVWQNMAHTAVVIWGASDSSPSSHGGHPDQSGSPTPTPSCTTSMPALPAHDISWTEVYFPNECRDKLTLDRLQAIHPGQYPQSWPCRTDGHGYHGGIDRATQLAGYSYLYSAPASPNYPAYVSYLTPVEKYDGAYWVHGLRRATVESGITPIEGSIQVSATGPAIAVTTANLAGFNLDLSTRNTLFSRYPLVAVTIDGGSPLTVLTGSLRWFNRSKSVWYVGSAPGPFVKRAGISGPLIDIFSAPTIFVYGIGNGNIPIVGRALTESILSGFLKERGLTNPIIQHGSYITKADTALTPEDIRDYNLVLIGTPAQNSIVHRIVTTYPNNMPFTFHRNGAAYDGVVIDATTYTAPKSGWSILCPNPLNPSHYALFASENYNSGSQPDSNGKPTKFGGMLSDWIIEGLVSGNLKTLASGTFPANWNLKSPTNPAP